MAPVNLPIAVTFTLQDVSGSVSYMQLNVDPATPLADVRTAADGITPELLGVSDCTIKGYSIAATTIFTPTEGVAAAGGRVERKGLISFRTAAGKIAQVTIPAVKPALVTTGGRLDEDNTAVSAFLTALQAAPWTDSNGASLNNVVEAYETFRTTRKRQKPSQRSFDADTTAGN